MDNIQDALHKLCNKSMVEAGATHWAETPDGEVLYYKITGSVLFWLPLSEAWITPGLVPYTLNSFDDERETKRQQIRNAVKSLTEYMQNYTKQEHYEDYTETIFIDDVLYGLGISLHPEIYREGRGYEEFKKRLRNHLDRNSALRDAECST